ncbi:hypothetical protein D049_3853A, partial [Vibrio parahaemolyticus VPTS-2010]
MLVGG